MTTTTESPDISPDINSTKPRRRAIGVLVAGSAAVALFALFGTTGPGAAETTVASAPSVQLVDDANDQAQQAENNAIQSMIQSEQQAQEQNDQAQQQAQQDEQQALQDEQQANQ